MIRDTALASASRYGDRSLSPVPPMYAENLLLLLDEIDELSVVAGDLVSPRAVAFALCALIGVAVLLLTGSLVLGGCALFSGITAVSVALCALDRAPAAIAPAPLDYDPV